MIPLRIFTFASLLFGSVLSALDFSCPAAPIRLNNGLSGVFPTGSNDKVPFPSGVNCKIQFVIPDGYVVRFSVFTSAVATSGDFVKIVDAMRATHIMPTGYSTYYAPASNAAVLITTVTNTSSLYLGWQFQHVSNYGRLNYTTGTALSLSLQPAYSYLFTSTRGSIVFTAETVDWYRYGPLDNIYVYDGDSLTSPYVGTLYYLKGSFRSTGKNLLFVNFYNDTNDLWGVANDFDAISTYALYNFYTLRSTDINNQITLNALSQISGAATFLVADGNEAHIRSLTVAKNGIAPQQMVQFQPLTPSQNMGSLLAYAAGVDATHFLPQQLPIFLFTMIVSSAQVQVTFSTGPNPTWLVPYAGRQGTIFSPSLWNPQATAEYAANFTSIGLHSWFTFQFTISSLTIPVAGAEKLRVEVGSASNASPAVVQFSQSTTSPQTRVANGTYMSTTFSGNALGSSFLVTFQITDPTPSVPPSSTSSPVQSTTKGCSTVFNFHRFPFSLFLLAVLLI